MSIRTEIDRITVAKAYIISAVEGKGVTVPSGTKIEDLPRLIDEIDNNPTTGVTIKYWTASDFGGV